MEKLPPHIKPTFIRGHFTVDPPPQGFDPRRASPEELQHFCLPHRPDPKQFPDAARMWVRAMSRVKRFVRPALTINSHTMTAHASRVQPKRKTPTKTNEAGLVAANFPDSWCGLVVGQNGVGFNEVWGTWVVPAVSVAPNQGGNFFSSLWVGINDQPGPATLENETGTPGSLIQAGTEQDASLGYNLFNGYSWNYYAFVEWFPGPQIIIGQSSPLALSTDQSFSVSPGQVITVHIARQLQFVGGPTWGAITFLNVSTGVALSPILIFPPTMAFDGSAITPPAFPSQAAVWILEATSIAADPPIPQSLADFGEAVMISGGAVGEQPGNLKSNVSVTVGDNDGGQLIPMTNSANQDLLATASEIPELTFSYVASS
jgi:hypothetical protein